MLQPENRKLQKPANILNSFGKHVGFVILHYFVDPDPDQDCLDSSIGNHRITFKVIPFSYLDYFAWITKDLT